MRRDRVEEPRRILIVDDDPGFLRELAESVEAAGFEAVAVDASEPRDIPEVALSVKPDLILLDVRMPGKGGLEIASELGRRPRLKKIPIIAMTGYASEARQADAPGASGISDWILKPFSLEELAGRIRAVLAAP